ncbi:MFS transporter [Synergistaceae bacterium OttesenSCG-928-I11]|nr:MFS transporter [Synergistaceae bacterium OttesenSCG-928-I11]
MQNTNPGEPSKDMGTYAIYALLVASYFTACLLRSSSSVVLPRLAESVGMASGAIGFISSMYFYGYTFAQPHSGTLCDRKGPLLSCALGMLLLAVGVFIFANSTTTSALAFGRFLTGLGAGPTFCGVLVYQARAFNPAQYPLLTGMTVSLGHLGGVFAISPMGAALAQWGHWGTHIGIAIAATCMGGFFLAVRRRDPISSAPPPKKTGGLRAIIDGFKMIRRSKKLSQLTALWGVVMVLQLTLIGLWGVSWLTDGGTLSESQARFCMSAGGVGVLIGAFSSGLKGGTWTETPSVMRRFGLLLCAVLLAFILATPSFGMSVMLPLSIAFGVLVGSLNVLSNATLHRIVDSSLIGTAMGTINTVLFFAVLVAQWLSGLMLEFVLDRFSQKGDGFAYSAVFLTILLLSLVAVAYFCRIKDYDREQALE